jgi:hypothetical protein
MVRELQSRRKGKVSAVPEFSKDERETTTQRVPQGEELVDTSEEERRDGEEEPVESE